MQNNEQEIKQHLLSHDEEYARLSKEHSNYETMLRDLLERPHLNESEQVEEIKIKKLKLSLKDRMEQIVQRHLHASV